MTNPLEEAVNKRKEDKAAEKADKDYARRNAWKFLEELYDMLEPYQEFEKGDQPKVTHLKKDEEQKKISFHTMRQWTIYAKTVRDPGTKKIVPMLKIFKGPKSRAMTMYDSDKLALYDEIAQEIVR